MGTRTWKKTRVSLLWNCFFFLNTNPYERIQKNAFFNTNPWALALVSPRGQYFPLSIPVLYVHMDSLSIGAIKTNLSSVFLGGPKRHLTSLSCSITYLAVYSFSCFKALEESHTGSYGQVTAISAKLSLRACLLSHGCCLSHCCFGHRPTVWVHPFLSLHVPLSYQKLWLSQSIPLSRGWREECIHQVLSGRVSQKSKKLFCS